MATHKNSFYDDVDEPLDADEIDTEDVNVERSAGTLDTSSVDEDENIEAVGKSSKKTDDEIEKIDPDVAEAESLTVACKRNVRQKLEDELASFLAKGGAIQEVPAEEHFAYR